MNIVNHPMAELAPPVSVTPCARSVILIVHARHRLPEEQDLAGVQVRVRIGATQAEGTTEADGNTAFRLQLAVGETADDLRPLEVEYQLVGDSRFRKVEWPVALATNRTLTQHVDSQRIGWEYECADVQMQMPGEDAADTYGESIVRTTKRGFKDLPIVDVTLEERKGQENPKIEVITAPLMKDDLRRAKAWLAAVLGGLAHGHTPAQWADAVGGPPCERSAQPRLRDNTMIKLQLGARLVQVNVDIFLDQLDREPNFIKTMMADQERPTHFDRARTCATAVVDAGRDASHDVRGLVTYALYTAIRNHRAAGVPDSLGKDRAQPLLKAGVDDLARAGLDAPKRALLLEVVRALCQPGCAALQAMCGQGAARNANMEAAVRRDLTEWFLERHARFPDDVIDPQDASRVGELGATIDDATPLRDADGRTYCAGPGHADALAAVAARHTCGVCSTSHAALPPGGRCCSSVVVQEPDRWRCPGCDRTYLAGARPVDDRCCSTAVVEVARMYRCGACNKVTAQAPPGNVCCEGALVARGAQYKCSACGEVQAERGSGRCPACHKGSLNRESVKVCNVAGCGKVYPSNARGPCKHAPVRDPQRWRCPACRRAHAVRPAGGQCSHVVVKDPDRWKCPDCDRVHAVRPVGDECWHVVVVDPAKEVCPTCAKEYPADGYPGQCPSGKRILPRKIHDRTLVVAEIRKDQAAFNRTHFHDVVAGQV